MQQFQYLGLGWFVVSRDCSGALWGRLGPQGLGGEALIRRDGGMR